MAFALAMAAATAMASGKDKVSVEDTTVFDRGIGSLGGGVPTFVPKGTIEAGLNVTYSNYSIGNGYDDDGFSMLLSLAQNIQGGYESFGISPHVSYFVRKNMSVGVRFTYGRDWLGLDNLDISLGDDMSFNIGNYHYLKNSYTASIFTRSYLPFGQSKRFALFYELRATGGWGSSESYKTGYDDVLLMNYKDGTYKDIYEFEIGVIPGIVVFLTNEAAVEVSVGMLGFDYQKTKQFTNQVEVSEMEKTTARFKVNLLSISFGVSYYIATGKHLKKK